MAVVTLGTRRKFPFPCSLLEKKRERGNEKGKGEREREKGRKRNILKGRGGKEEGKGRDWPQPRILHPGCREGSLCNAGLAGERTVDSTTVENASSIYKSRLGLGVDHEVLRTLVLNAELGMGKDDFENIDREDDLWELRLGGKYLMNRYVQVLFGYRYQDRDTDPSDSGGRIFEINEVFLRLAGQL